MKQFQNVSPVLAPLQKKTAEGVKKNLGGRPKKPFMKSVQIRMDRALEKKLNDFAKRNYMDKSQAISRAVVMFMDQFSK